MRSISLPAFSLVLAFSMIAPVALAWAGTPRAPAPPPATPGTTTLEGVQGLIRAGRYADAEREARDLLRDVEQIYGADTMPVAEVLDVLAEAMRNGGRSGAPDALAICERAVRLKGTLAGKSSAPYAASLHNLGALHMVNGDYTRARPYLEEALEIRKRVLGEHHKDVARSLLFLANLETMLGKEQAAVPLVERAITIQRSALAEDDPERARGMNMLAVLRFNLGDYLTPGPLWEQVLSLRRRTLGADHPLVAETLHNLGVLATETGDADLALDYLNQALEIRRSRLGSQHSLVASTLVVIANLLRDSGDNAGARVRFEEALRIRESGTPNPDDLSWTLMQIGKLLVAQGDYARAEPMLRRARALREKELGSENPDIGWILNELAAVAEHGGRKAEARELYQRSLRIQEAAYGASYPDVVVTLGHYCRFLAAAGDTAEALNLAQRGARARLDHLRSTTRGLAERQALAYAAVGSPTLDVLLGIAAATPGRGVAAKAWDVLIRSRTIVLDEIASRHRLALAVASDSSVAAPLAQLDDARRRYASLLVRGIGADDPGHYRAAIDRARDEVESAERTLAARSRRFRTEQTRDDIGWAEVSAALPKGWGLVAFTLQGSGAARSYVAFVARPGRDPGAIPIGSASEIEALIRRWSAQLARGGATKGRAAPSGEAACREAGIRLRRRIWDPFRDYFRDVERVFVVPDGSLHLVNFSALPSPDGGYLVETGPLLHYLSAERDLVRRGGGSKGRGILAFGGAAFDRRETRETAATPGAADHPKGVESLPGTETRSAHAPKERGGPQPECQEFRSTRFQPLPESAREIREVVSAWGDSADAMVLTGERAGEGAFKALAAGRRVLHLATHGFFLDATRCATERAGARGIGGLSSDGARPLRLTSRRGSPLLLSGLALAGANLRLDVRPDQEDGILMAQEVVSLDLSSAEWVVLSACDTGLGKLQAGEGVLGLRRSFEAAGAATVIMSLWEVEDLASRQWMHQLYEARFRDRRSTPEAVRDASLRVLRDRRAQGRSTHPFYWAGFVAAGDWN